MPSIVLMFFFEKQDIPEIFSRRVTRENSNICTKSIVLGLVPLLVFEFLRYSVDEFMESPFSLQIKL